MPNQERIKNFGSKEFITKLNSAMQYAVRSAREKHLKEGLSLHEEQKGKIVEVNREIVNN